MRSILLSNGSLKDENNSFFIFDKIFFLTSYLINHTCSILLSNDILKDENSSLFIVDEIL